jgi:hypothetical protein
MGAGRTRTSVNVGHFQELVCASLRYNASVNPLDLLAITAGRLKTALAYPNLFNVVVQVTSIRLCDTGDGRTANLCISDTLHQTWRCWISQNLLGIKTNNLAFGSLIFIRSYKLRFIPRYGVMTMVINEIQVLTGGLPLVGAPQSFDGIMASSMESPGNWSVDLKEWEAPLSVYAINMFIWNGGKWTTGSLVKGKVA